MENEWSDKQKYDTCLENLIENHVIVMKYLYDNFGGTDAIVKFYSAKNELNYNAKIGKLLKLGAKVLKTVSSRKFFDIFINQMTKNAQHTIPLKVVSGIDYGDRKAVIHIDKCVSKRLFRKSVKRYKVQDEIPFDGFCKFNCIPVFSTFARIGNIKISAVFREKGCDITAEMPKASTTDSTSD
jgi:hypothetical protein